MSNWPVDIDPIYGCWIWQGQQDRDGYGIRWCGRHPKRAHCLVYEQMVGAVGEGLELDHLCRRRLCVRPGHMECVTRKENVRRRRLGYRVRRKHCAAGHELYEGRRTPEGGRVCLLCAPLVATVVEDVDHDLGGTRLVTS